LRSKSRVAGVANHGRGAEVPGPSDSRIRLANDPCADRKESDSELPDGRLLYRLKRSWRDGTNAVIFERQDFMAKLNLLDWRRSQSADNQTRTRAGFIFRGGSMSLAKSTG